MIEKVKYLLLLYTFFSCSNKNIKSINIGEFAFKFPIDFKLTKEQGIDSYVGKVSNGKINFQFDYGYYSNSLDKTKNQYLQQDVWKYNVLYQNKLLQSGTDLNEIVKAITLLESRSMDNIHYSNLYLFKKDTLSYQLRIPQEILTTKIEIDTVGTVIFKYIRKRGYVGLYAKNLSTFNETIKIPISLTIFATNLKPEETELAYKLLRTCSLKK